MRQSYVSEAAYAAYLAGAIAEQQADYAAAEAAYARAAQEAPESADAWARLGAVRCVRTALAERDGRASQAFARAISADPLSATPWFERARCSERRGDPARALADAHYAFALDPSSTEIGLLLARLYEQNARAGDALALLEDLAHRDSANLALWRTLRRLATAYGDQARNQIAVRALAAHPAEAVADDDPTLPFPLLVAVDDALQRGDNDAAVDAAHRAHLAPARLALRAAAVGHLRFASEHARLVLRADPTNADAFVALLYAADLDGNTASYDDVLLHAATVQPPLSEIGTLLLAELAERRTSAHVGLVIAPPASDPGSRDALLSAVHARLLQHDLTR